MSLYTFERSVRIERPAAAVFAWHERPGAFARLAPPWQEVSLLSQRGGIRDGAEVVVQMKLGPLPLRWEIRHQDYIEGVQFRDVQVRGPFAHWDHLHRMEPAPDDAQACILTDRITFKPPGGVLGRLGVGYVRGQLEQLFRYRHEVTRLDLESVAAWRTVRPLTFLIAGSSGLVGQALVPFLQTQGHRVLRLVRGGARGQTAVHGVDAAIEPAQVHWDPASGQLDPAVLRGVDVVINLAGAGIADRRWTPERQAEILRSRVDTTQALARALAEFPLTHQRQRPFVLISASASGFYGSRGDAELDETAGPGEGFLASVCTQWEAATRPAEEAGVRVVHLRTSMVLSPKGGALRRLLWVFGCGAGGRLGHGRQWMSWIGLDDVVGAIYHAVLDTRCTGPLNLATPYPVTNREFTQVLARVLHRPAWFPVPPPLLRLGLGSMADELLLASTRLQPAKLLDAGYRFREEKLDGALRQMLGKPNLRPTA